MSIKYALVVGLLFGVKSTIINQANGQILDKLYSDANCPIYNNNIIIPEENRNSNVISEFWFDQLLDHFNKSSSCTFKQRYFVNRDHYKPGGPAFLMIGGSAAMYPFEVHMGLLDSAAKLHGGVVVGLEHRYYGRSTPFKDNELALENSSYLSSKQAIEDIGRFINNFSIPGVDLNSTYWVVAGRSYGGSLAAWARLKLHHLIKGAIASSAPIQAKEDFYEYDLQIQKSLSSKGGEACAQYFVDVTNHIDGILINGTQIEKNEFKRSLNESDRVSDLDIAFKLLFITDDIQDFDDGSNNHIRNLCSSLSLSGTINDKVGHFVQKYLLYKKENKEFSEELAYGRKWNYQCCMEFGYWQVAPKPPMKSTRSQLIDVVNYRKRMCNGKFGPGIPELPNTTETNNYYKGKDINVTNVLFTNGEFDPWAPLSLLHSNHPTVSTYIIKGESHVSDLIPFGDSIRPQILTANNMSLALISDWLKK